jgi:hypothetical protein
MPVFHFRNPKKQRPNQRDTKNDKKWYIEISQVIVEENSYHYEHAGYTYLKNAKFGIRPTGFNLEEVHDVSF